MKDINVSFRFCRSMLEGARIWKREKYQVMQRSEKKNLMTESARGVMVIVAGIGHGDTSSNPGLIAFHIALGKGMNPLILPPAMGK